VVFIFLLSLTIKDVRLIATFVTGFTLLVLGVADTVFYVEVKSLMPALQSYWLVIHVLVAVLATAFFNIAAALSIAYVLKTAKWVKTSKAKAVGTFRRVLALFPKEEQLERLAYRRCDLGRASLAPLLGLGHQGGLDLHHLDHLCRLPARQRDPRLERKALSMVGCHWILGNHFQLHNREPVLQGSARL
jgi:hypothetical protein